MKVGIQLSNSPFKNCKRTFFSEIKNWVLHTYHLSILSLYLYLFQKIPELVNPIVFVVFALASDVQSANASIGTSVTRLGDLLDFGQVFLSLWQQLICPNLSHSKANFGKLSKSSIFLLKSFLGNFYRHLAIFLVTLMGTYTRYLLRSDGFDLISSPWEQAMQ